MHRKDGEMLTKAKECVVTAADTLVTMFMFINEFLGVKFAPLDLPVERRLQTLGAAGWIFLMVFGEGIAIAVAVYLIRSDHYWIVLIYILIIARNRDNCNYGSSAWSWARKWRWWEYLRDYFPAKMVKTEDLDPEKNYLMCCFPHGVLCTGVFISFATDANGFHELFPNMKPHLVTLAGHFMVPFFRELVSWLGLCSASATSINFLLDKSKGKGRCTALVVGGAAESLNCHPGEYKVVLKRRKGFIKLAMLNGAPLVPVFSFGETDIFDQLQNPPGSIVRRIQDTIRTLTGVAPIFPMGRGMLQYSVGIVPQRKPLTTVVGRPMEVQRNLDPTDEEINAVHAEFTNRLIDLFENEKSKYLSNPKEAQLIIE